MKKKKLLTLGTLLILVLGGLSIYHYSTNTLTPKIHIKNKTSLIQYNPKRDYSSAVMVNLDNDEEEEIFVSVIEDSSIFFKKLYGKLVPLEINQLEDRGSITVSVTPCDLDQDGRDEILIINSLSRSRIMNFKTGDWLDMLTDEDDSIIKNLSNSYAATCIDRKGDGKFGLAVVSENGPLQYLELKESKITDVADKIGLNSSSRGRSILGIPGPDGQTNILVGNENDNVYFQNNSGTFMEKTAGFKHKDIKLETRGISLIDFNHDQIMDVIYGNQFGHLRILQQDKSGKFKEVAPKKLSNNDVVNSPLVEDFNLDGYEDIYLNNIKSKNTLFAEIHDQWTKISLGKYSEKNLFGVSSLVADLDDNGSFEILNTHGDGKLEPLTVYSFRPEGNWIKIKPRLKNGGVPRGTVVHLKTNLHEQTKSVSTGSGRYANYDDVLLFGLGKDEKIESAEIIMPSGKKSLNAEDLRMFQTNTIKL